MTCKVGRCLTYDGYWVAFILVLPVSADAASFDHLGCRFGSCADGFSELARSFATIMDAAMPPEAIIGLPFLGREDWPT